MFSIGINQLQARSVFFLLTFPLFLNPLLAGATTFYERPFEETVQDAPTIVRGSIGNSYADWSKGLDGTKRIYTYFDVQVTEVLKGSAQKPSLVLRQLGGEKDGVGLQIAGSASFERGEDVVIFTGKRNGDGSYELLGLSMGKLNFEKDENGHEYLVGAAIPGTGRDGHDHHDTGGHADPGIRSRWSLDDLRNLIRKQDPIKNTEDQSLASEKPVLGEVDALLPSPAPQLQPPSSREAEESSSGLWKGLGVLLLIGFIWKFAFSRKIKR
ncbi:MAG TPA: hypothetical protein DCS07_09635 [Bdellovibrionales bacterium]|nr:MAG: hypothetical protein A2Z97_08850 [Bdellovibrionales bacterium GWB1_52_6]OFZ03971.1 MAG: hypothetical protein A2X97_08545 [Bdellovibrionales bacterium GWA1_52_35]OFZ40707.1 MAG: hypothetical protein A2070_08485 [Bdellovibrionales bacterium GWC1_52_8]HAR42872.1 hypothetical protein [Bdellovibrionales bacterium]HCM39784.1 hypothetical protein [Bdellovibrionales bacterium]